jgi:hypothetical protein
MTRKPKAGRMHKYTAIVEGVEGGVPFRLYFKREDKARALCRQVPGAELFLIAPSNDCRPGVVIYIGRLT